MEKEEFLRTLGGALSGEVPQHIIQENLRYYDNYISDEMRKGRTEADIIEELGDHCEDDHRRGGGRRRGSGRKWSGWFWPGRL